MKSYLGIDVSKGYSDFVLISESLEQLEDSFQLDDTIQGHNKLEDWIKQVIKSHGITQIYSAVESTGGFENNWFSFLKKVSEILPVKVSRLNPVVVKNSARASLNTQVTDELSAKNIALYIARYSDQVDFHQPENEYRAYRSLQKHIQLLTKQKTQLINEMKQLLYSCFPELQRYCKSSIPTWVLELLIQYPTVKRLSRARVASISKIKGITQAKAEKLLANAKKSISSRFDDSDGFLITTMAEDIQAKQKQLERLKMRLENTCKGPEVDRLQTMIGVGAYSAASVMIEIEDISRFPSPKHLAGYFGVHPSIKASGDKTGVSRMSKAGRPAIRAALYMCAMVAVRHDEHLKSVYVNQRARGNAHRQAIGVVMHKMLRIIWGMLTSETAYNPKVDQENQDKALPINDVQSNEIKNKRRLQEYDRDAPISRVAYKKRRVHQAS